MRTLVRWAVVLYPAAWRARYGGELEALMEDAGVRGGDVWDLVRGAMFMQMTSLNFGKIVAGFALAGVLAAGIWAAMQPKQYVSTAVMRMSSPEGGASTDRMAQMRRLQRLQQGALSRKSLTTIIVAQNLFQQERQRLPLEDIIQEMRNRNIQIRMMDERGWATFAVNYSASSPGEAQAVTRAIVAALVEQNVAKTPEPGEVPANIEVIDPASLPSKVTGDGLALAVGRGGLVGLALGLIFGALTWALQRSKVSVWRIAGFAVAGMAVGLGIAFLIPNEYISTAVLGTVDPAKVQATITQVLSDDSIAALIQRERLFMEEVKRDGMEKVVRQVKNERIQVRSVNVSGKGGKATAYVVSFRYPDRFASQRITQSLVKQLTGQPNTQVLDPASDPMRPSSPNRLQIAGLGSIFGVLLGLAAMKLRRNTPITA